MGRAVCWAAVLLHFRLDGLYFSRTSLEENIKREEDDDKQSVAERTIVFHGSILEGKGPCVSSWPGKYESAWDVLVTGSRKGNVSAAVVFLPEGSEHFGCHDPIPEEENLEGSCWCIPVYGEQKRWGCRWWTKWMNNIEEAVRQGAELEVYFFAGMVGKGKVENFSMAGKEHLRREAIQGKLKQFLKSSEFQAIDRGIECLWKSLVQTVLLGIQGRFIGFSWLRSPRRIASSFRHPKALEIPRRPRWHGWRGRALLTPKEMCLLGLRRRK